MIDRRSFQRGLTSAVAASALAPFSLGAGALAQGASGGDQATAFWREYRQIALEAQKLNLTAPRFAAGVTKLDDEAMLPAITDLLENLEASAKTLEQRDAAVDTLLDKAAELLRKTVALDTAPSDGRQDPATRSFGLAARPQASKLKSEYERLFKTCEINSKNASTVNWYVAKLTDPENRARYETVAQAVCAPWFFVGIIHAMEAGFNFRGHLHNGDNLKRRTVNIPAGRPKVWEPPYRWEDSAIDAIHYDHLANLQDWSLALTLYRWEAYNGFRSRLEHNINTPYLWSFSNHYTRGKFVRDNVWSDTAVSSQCGAAVMLKVLVERGLVTNAQI